MRPTVSTQQTTTREWPSSSSPTNTARITFGRARPVSPRPCLWRNGFVALLTWPTAEQERTVALALHLRPGLKHAGGLG